MNTDTGHILLHRKILKWEWFTDQSTCKLFIYCILRANWQKARFRGTEIERGEFITSLETLKNELGLSVRNIRTALDHLKNTGEISEKVFKNFRIIRVNNYDKYQQFQSSDEPDVISISDSTDNTDIEVTNDRQTGDKQVTNDRQTGDKQVTNDRQTGDKQVTTDNINNNKNNKNNNNKNNNNKKNNNYYITQIVDYLNKCAGTSFSSDTGDTASLITARLGEGYTLSDFRRVIDKKCAEWLGDNRMRAFLRPSTLFGSKFENYLNSAAVVTDRSSPSAYNGYDDTSKFCKKYGENQDFGE